MAKATTTRRHNFIVSLQNSDNMGITDHDGKAALLWYAFKQRLGTSVDINFPPYLQNLLSPGDPITMRELEKPFTIQEIKALIDDLPNGKSPRSDGFNNEFYKACWDIIATDIITLIESFFNGNICLESINSSFITLIPKIANPQGPNDFRPISLLNTSVKIITKLLANRLQLIILKLIHINQYGFLKDRAIQDCIAWAFEYLFQCQSSGKECLLLKLEFEKDFDTVEHQAIIKVLQAKGFGDKWINWMHLLFNSATSVVLLNGVPGKKFYRKKRCKAREPTFPFTFCDYC